MSKELAGIQYMGEAGITQECLDAVMRLLQFDDHLTKVRILSDDDRYCLLITVGEFDLIAIKSGFSFGYSGEGPRGFSLVLALFQAHKIEMDEFMVSKDVINRLENSALTKNDIQKINLLKPVRPRRFYEYISDKDFDGVKAGTLWQDSRPVIPFAIIDPRIMDLAISFWKHPGANLDKGYKRFEDIVRARTGIDDEGSRLFTEAFLHDNSVLGWKNVKNSEKKGRANLIIGAYSAYRNPRAHKEKTDHSYEDLSEFLLLNQLFRLESEAAENSK